MCLFIKENAKKRVAKRPITVYKHVFKSMTGDILTPYQSFKVEEGKLYTSSLCRKTEPLDMIDIGLHSFRTKRDALADVKSAMRNVGITAKAYYIVKCIIPKGSSYYVGTTFNVRSYASDAIKYGKLVEVKP